jgi:hypothetical protein
MNCPKCDADVSETYEGADPSVGIMSAGYFCEACDLGIAADDYEPSDGDVQIGIGRDPSQPLGTPLSSLSGQPGDPRNLSDPRHAGFARFLRIARSWGFD